MQTRTRLNIALVGGLVVIAGLFWFSAQDQSGDEPMLGIDGGAIEQLSVDGPDGPRWTLQRRDGDWRLSEPMTAPAHPDRVQQLITLLRAPVHRHWSVDEVEPARFGLDEPVLTIEVNGQQLQLGDSEPLQRRRYVLRGEQVLLVDDIVYFQFARSATNLVDNRLLPGGGPVTMIEFAGQRLARGDDGRWHLQPGEEALAHLEHEDLGRMAGNWLEAQARQTLGWPEPSFEAPRIRVHQATGETRALYLLESNASDFTLGNPATGLRYRFSAGQRPALMPDPAVWADGAGEVDDDDA